MLSGRAAPCFLGRPDRDAIEPVRQLLAPADRSGPPRQDEKGRLKGILRVVRIGQHPATDAQNHRAMAMDQDSERILGDVSFAGQESLQQLGLGHAAERPQGVERLDLSEDDLCRSSLHRLTLSGRPLVSSFFLSGTGRPSPGAFKNRGKTRLY